MQPDYKKEAELKKLQKDLDKEKAKRNIIMGMLCSALVCWIISPFDGADSVLGILGGIAVSVFLGFLLYFATIAAFLLVTKLFTNIDSIESSVKYLEEEIRKSQ